MKTPLKIAVIAGVVVLVLAALGIGVALAQTGTPPALGYGWGIPAGMMGGGYGMMGGYNIQNGTPAPRSGYWMMGGYGQNSGYGWMQNMREWMFATGGMHTLVWNGLADALKLTPDEFQKQLASGKTLAQIAEAQGVSQAQLAAALETSMKAGLDKAVADGVLTREQADSMLSRMSGNYEWMISNMGAGFGPGGCHGSLVPQNNS